MGKEPRRSARTNDELQTSKDMTPKLKKKIDEASSEAKLLTDEIRAQGYRAISASETAKGGASPEQTIWWEGYNQAWKDVVSVIARAVYKSQQ